MLILSFDVGIKNLAYCLLEYDFEKKTKLIKKWDIINLSFYDTSEPDINLLLANYKSMKISELKGAMSKYELPTEHKKAELLKILEKYLFKNNYLKKKMSIQDTGLVMVSKLDQLTFLKEADLVLIENQPSLKNPVMKSVQMLLYSYFLIRGMVDLQKVTDIKLISASNKLKKCNSIEQFKGRTKEYKDRKKLAIDYCYYLLEQLEPEEQKEYFSGNCKKDDLADSYLQAMYYLEGNPKC